MRMPCFHHFIWRTMNYIFFTSNLKLFILRFKLFYTLFRTHTCNSLDSEFESTTVYIQDYIGVHTVYYTYICSNILYGSNQLAFFSLDSYIIQICLLRKYQWRYGWPTRHLSMSHCILYNVQYTFSVLHCILYNDLLQ